MGKKVKYNRILLKLSGEFLGKKGGNSIDAENFFNIAYEVKTILKYGIEVGLVIGAGNIFRGDLIRQKEKNRRVFKQVNADKAGMFGTIINSILLSDAFSQIGVKSKVISSIFIDSIEFFNFGNVNEYFKKGYILIFGGGTSNPFFTTDTSAVLKAIEINADILLKATKVEGVYDKDPMKFKDASFFSEITYKEVIEKQLKVMDLTAISLAMDNNLPVTVFNFFKKGNLLKVIKGKKIGTLIK